MTPALRPTYNGTIRRPAWSTRGPLPDDQTPPPRGRGARRSRREPTYDLIAKCDLDGNTLVQKLEVAKAIKAGIIDYTKPEINDEIKILKAMAQYFQKGFNGANLEATRNAFFQQKSAIYQSTTGFYPVAVENPLRKFEIGAFYFPPITKATSQYANEAAPMTNKGYGYGGFNYGITNVALKDNLAEACANFMMFATQPEQLAAIVNEARVTIPNAKGSTPLPQFQAYSKSLAYAIPPWEEDDVWLDIQYGESYLKTMQPWLEGSADLNTTVAAINKNLQAGADRVIAQAEKVKSG